MVSFNLGKFMEEFIKMLELNLLLKSLLSGAKFKVFIYFRTEKHPLAFLMLLPYM